MNKLIENLEQLKSECDNNCTDCKSFGLCESLQNLGNELAQQPEDYDTWTIGGLLLDIQEYEV